MKLYHLKQGIGIEHDGQSYLLQNESWEALINRDDSRSVVLEKLNTATKLDTISAADILSPLGQNQELWACGVTYLRSREGRQEESKSSGGSEFYAHVYEAARPEVFFKATPHRVVGHGGFVRIRKDSSWDVPEPELTLVVTTSGKIIGYTIGNDMSSRSIEGENPLYLPQAKTYDGCAALGPCIYLPEERLSEDTQVRLQIHRTGSLVFEGAITLSQMKRTQEELVAYVFKECSFPYGCFIMTGTGIVPSADFTLHSQDEIHISIDSIGTLINTVS
ncbi:MAG: fumarylacetoacetate hydrolase family protein [Saprospiraceae bacterium]|nr:fumarylacetoacetate hydrolase family protein [Saprospiraceae bacterium]